MKKYIIILFTLILTVSSVQAATFPNQLPGGKNYINPENLVITGDVVTTLDFMKINPNTVYTISFPGNELLYNHEILIETENAPIFDDVFSNASACTLSDDFASCTFSTPSNVSQLSFTFTAQGVGQYVNSYGYVDFQLEEGIIRTTYEPYEEPLSDSNNPTFSGTGAFIVSYYDSIPLEDIIGTHIMAIDDIDGDISDQILIESDEYTVNMNTVGSYLVEMFVSDAAGNITTFNLTMIVKDEVAPLIDGPDVIDINIDNIISITDIIDNEYTGVDGYDSLIPVNIKTDNYSANTSTLGTYEVELESEDTSGNITLKTIDINILDTTLPTMTGNSHLEVFLSNLKDVDTLLGELILYDNYDVYEDLIITVINDTYTGNESTLGEYYVDFLVEDTSGNIANYRMDLMVKDDINPEISGPESLQVSYVDILIIEDIIDMYDVNDNYDSLEKTDIEIESNEYHNRSELVGEFDIILSITDVSNNTSSITLTITVVDDQAPIIYIDDYIVNVAASSSFSPRDALLMMINNKEIPNGEYDVVTLIDEYSGNEGIPGSYDFRVLIKDNEGKEFTKDLIIKVAEPHNVNLNQKLIVRNVISYSIVSVVVILSIIKYRKITG